MVILDSARHHIAQKFLQAVFRPSQDRGWKLKTGANLGSYDRTFHWKGNCQYRLPLF